jgi:ferredoxin
VRVTVDYELCQGHGMCVLEAPEVFALDKDDDQVRLLVQEPDESLRSKVSAAVHYCPTMALSIED